MEKKAAMKARRSRYPFLLEEMRALKIVNLVLMEMSDPFHVDDV